LLRALAVALALSVAPAVFAVDSGDIVVVSVRGEVHVSMNGAARKVRGGTVLELPATLRTGRDGAIEIRQGASSVRVGPETTLEFPALEKRGAPVDRILQPRGNAFYDIGKREGRRLRVETPYLVGVIKGTQFNVAAQESGTTISLFEGALEIHASDDSSVVDLEAGEIATRRRGDTTISVMPMEAGSAPPSRLQRAAPGQGDVSRVADSAGSPAGVEVPRSAATAGSVPVAVGTEVRAPTAVVSADATPESNTAVSTAAVSGIEARPSVDVVASPVAPAVGVDVVPPSAVAAIPPAVEVEASMTRVTPAPTGLDAGTSPDVGAVETIAEVGVDAGDGGTRVDLQNQTQVDAGPVAVDTATEVSVDAGAGGASVDVGHQTQIEVGPVTVNVDTSADVDAGSGGVADVAGNVSVDLAPVPVDVDTGAAVDVATDTVNADVDTSTSDAADVPEVDAAVDVGTGSVALGTNVAGLEVDIGVDLGTDDAAQTSTDTDTAATPPADPGNDGSTDVGGRLDGLLRRPGRR
jgi:hypothetical protein